MIRRTFLAALGLLPFVPKAKAEPRPVTPPKYKKAVIFTTDVNRHTLVLLADTKHDARYGRSARIESDLEVISLDVGTMVLTVVPVPGVVTWALGTYGLALPPHVFTGNSYEIVKEFSRIAGGNFPHDAEWMRQQMYSGTHFYIRHETAL